MRDSGLSGRLARVGPRTYSIRTYVRVGGVVMSVQISESRASLEFEAGLPIAVRWRGERWRVLDRPTPSLARTDRDVHPLITHPPERIVGWTCIARGERSGDTYTLELRAQNRAWRLVHAWD